MRKEIRSEIRAIVIIGATIALLSACSPTVKVDVADTPIEINIHVKIEQEVVVRVDKELNALFLKDADLFGVSNKP